MKPPTNKELDERINNLSHLVFAMGERLTKLEKGEKQNKPAANPLAGLRWGEDCYNISFEPEMAKFSPAMQRAIINELNRLYEELYLEAGYTVSFLERKGETIIGEGTEEESELSSIITEFFSPVMSTAQDVDRNVVLYYLLKK